MKNIKTKIFDGVSNQQITPSFIFMVKLQDKARRQCADHLSAWTIFTGDLCKRSSIFDFVFIRFILCVRFCIGIGRFTYVFPGGMPIFLVDFRILSVLRLLSERGML